MSLLLGPTSVGKTLLMKRLEANITGSQQNEGIGLDCPSTISTVGTIMVNVSVSRRQEVIVREVGGCMGPIWQNYYKDCEALMFMIDISNRLQTSAACIQLLSTLGSEKLSKVPVLIIFNKIDMPEKMSASEIDTVFRFSDIQKHSSQTITTVEISAATGQGLSDVVKWLDENCHSK